VLDLSNAILPSISKASSKDYYSYTTTEPSLILPPCQQNFLLGDGDQNITKKLLQHKIRLLKIHPGEFGNVVECSMITHHSNIHFCIINVSRIHGEPCDVRENPLCHLLFLFLIHIHRKLRGTRIHRVPIVQQFLCTRTPIHRNWCTRSINWFASQGQAILVSNGLRGGHVRKSYAQ
jgi:hypothetical protein